MMKIKNLLSVNRVVAFLAFLFAFGKLCFEWGYNKSHDGFVMLVVFPLFYLGILFAAHKFCGNMCYTKRPYILIAIVISFFILLIWGMYLIIYFNEQTEGVFIQSDIWYACLITGASLIMAFIYFWIAFRFDIDKK